MLRPEQLEQHLRQQPLRPIYWLAGDETLIVEESLDRLRAAARTQGFEERECHFVEAGFDWHELLHASHSLSLFAERKLIELRLRNAKPDETGRQVLGEYADNANPDTLLLITSPRLDATTRKSKWFNRIMAAGALVQIWPVDASRLPQWIADRFRQHGLHADREAVQLLAERVEGNLLAAAQEIEKLQLLLGGDVRQVDARLVAGTVGHSARYNVFSMLDHALAGRAGKAVQSLHGLRSEGTEPLLILAVISKELRLLTAMASRMEQGEPAAAAMQQSGVWKTRQKAVAQALQRLGADQPQRLLQQATRVDHAVKGLLETSPWLELDHLVLAIAGTPLATAPLSRA